MKNKILWPPRVVECRLIEHHEREDYEAKGYKVVRILNADGTPSRHDYYRLLASKIIETAA